MMQNFNIGFLKTVSLPIIDSLKKSRENINNNLILAVDKNLNGSDLDFTTISEINNAKGALQMIDLPGVVLVLSRLQELVKQVKDTTNTNKVVDSLKISLKSIDNIIIYIEQLKNGEKDRPMKLFDDYKQINFFLNKDSTPKDLFFPKIDILNSNQKNLDLFFKVENIFNEERLFKTITSLKTITSSVAFEKSILEICELISQVKTAFESNRVDKVTGVMFIQSIQEKIINIKKSIASIKELKINKHFNTMFNLYDGFLSTLEPNNNQNFPQLYSTKAKELKFCLLKLTSESRVLIKDLEELSKKSSSEIDQNIKKFRTSKEIQKELVYIISVILLENSDLLKTVENQKLITYIDLNDYIEQLSYSNVENNFVQKDSSSLDFLLKTFIDVKEEFISITSKEQKTDASVFMKKFHSHLNKLNEQTVSLNLEMFKPLTSSLLNFILKITTKSVDYNDYIRDEISFAINFTDKFLNTHLKNNSMPFSQEDSEKIMSLVNRISELEKTKGKEVLEIAHPTLSKTVSEQDRLEVHSQAFGQLLEDLVKTEEIIEEFFKSKGSNPELLKEVVQTLMSSRGVLQLTGKKELAEIAKNCAKVVESYMINISNVSPNLIKHTNAQIAAIVLYAQSIKNYNTEEANQIFQRIVVLNKEFSINNGDNELIDLSSIMVEKDPITNQEKPKEKEIIVSTNNSNVVEEVKSKEKVREEVINIELPDFSILNDISENNENNEKIEITNLYKDSTNNDELGEIFILEAQEVLENLYTDLETLKSDVKDKNNFVTVKRAFHTLKGSARMVDYKFIGDSAWLVEQSLNKLLEAEQFPTIKLLDTLKVAAKIIEGYVNEVNNSSDKTANVDLFKMFDLIKPFNESLSFSPAIAQIVQEKNKSEKNQIKQPIKINTPVQEVEISRKVEAPPAVLNDLLELNIEDITISKNIEKPILEKTTITINEQEIDKQLYSLYEIESGELFNEIDSYFNTKKDFDDNFVRYFHTLSSISKSVNVEQLSSIAYIIENLIRTSLEKDYVFSNDDIDLLEESFNLIKEIKENLKAKNNNKFINYQKYLNDLQNKVVSYEATLEISNDNESIEIDLNENDFNENFDELKVQTNEEKIKEIKEFKISEDSSSMILELLNKQFNNLTSQIQNLNQSLNSALNKIDEQNQIINSLEKNLKNNDELNDKLLKLQNKLEDNLKENQNDLMKVLQSLIKKEHTTDALEEKLSNSLSSFKEEQQNFIKAIAEEIKTTNKQVLIQGIKLIRKDITDK